MGLFTPVTWYRNGLLYSKNLTRTRQTKENALSLSFPSAFYVPYQDVFVPRDRPASRVYIPFPNVDWVSGWVWGGGGGEVGVKQIHHRPVCR